MCTECYSFAGASEKLCTEEHYKVSGPSTGIGPSAIVRSMKAAHLSFTHAWAWSVLPRNGEWVWPVYRACTIKESQRRKGPLHLG